ncbi:MAG: EAL domain-containing protein, partial [Oscillospiraceae bacterium]
MRLSKTVLIIDDNTINRQILSKILAGDYNVITAKDGFEGLEILKQYGKVIAAVMLDLVMPKLDGYGFLQKKSTMPEFDDIPVIVTTSENAPENEISTLKSGAWDFVSKPYHPDIIKARLDNVIARSQLSAFEQLKYLAEYDTLTGIFNKTKLFSQTEKILELNKDTKFMAMRFDINRFGLVNSFYGFEKGDSLLKYLANCFTSYLQKYPVCVYGRIEGDVFGVCIPYTGQEVIDEIIENSKQAVKAFNLDFDMVITFGIYIIEDHSMPAHLIFDRATLASKECKGNYVNSYAIFNREMQQKIEAEQEITNEMNEALLNGQFVVYYQPKYDLKSGNIAGSEALVRWLHPIKGLISPADFIPIFEHNGFISKLDAYVWESVCKQQRKWLDDGTSDLPVSVNVSRINLYNPKITEIIEGLTKKYKIPLEIFNLEITESVYAESQIALANTIAELHSKGFSVFMDDFGSGYSSLNTLKSLEFDVLKIDMKFLSEESTSRRSR